MNNKRPFVPTFLQKFDDKLLKNKPNTWAARTHLVLFFAIVFALVLTAFCYLTFFDARQYSNVGVWNIFLGLIAFIGLVFWLIFLLRFNVFKRYGNWFAWDGLKSFVLYFISIGLMVGVCFIPSAIETFRANQQFGDEEIVKDINDINTTACQLEYNLLPKKWNSNEFQVVDTFVSKNNNYYNDDAATVADAATVVSDTSKAYVYKIPLIDTSDFRKKLAEADSVVKVNDSIYRFYDCPNYRFVSSYKADGLTKSKLLTSKEIYYTVLQNYKPIDRPALLKKMEAFKTKYSAKSRYDYYDSYTEVLNENDTYEQKIRKMYDLNYVNNGVDNITSKKYQWVNDWSIYLRVFYYITLVFTMLVFIFRHTTVKTFFLSVLAGVILTILTGLIMAVSYSSRAETTILSFLIFYYVAFAAIALTIFGAKTRTAIQGIGLNLFLFATPFLPMIFVALNKSIRYYEVPLDYDYGQAAESTRQHFLIAEFAGSIILLILIELLFRKLYRKWFAAPEN